jgi:UDP-N-acetylmuramate--L-alanine ligase/UDP-N-acetylenolpyruvoylglucosamine reductase
MQNIHFIGIKGVGMSALAIVAKGLGYHVTGSDVAEEFITDEPLRSAGIVAHAGFAAEHVAPDVELIIAGAAYGDGNPEMAEAKARGLKVLTYSEMLGYLSSKKKLLAVAGTHGKTTTTSILSYLLYASGRQPSYVIGTGHVAGLPSHGLAGLGEYFVAEADDYKKAPNDPTPKFLDLEPLIGIITSIEHDHPDMYPTLQDCIEAFYRFAIRVKPEGLLVVNGDDKNVHSVMQRLADRTFVTFGFEAENQYRIEMDGALHEGTQIFSLYHEGKVTRYRSSLLGKHNVCNAAAAVIVALHSGMRSEEIQRFLPQVVGVERRYQTVGEKDGRLIIDDYAHHPTAVQLTLETARRQYPSRPLWCLFQPHTYSRTKALMKEFGQAFGSADVVIVTDIFGSAREAIGDVTARDVVEEIGKHHRNVLYVPMQKLQQFIERNLPEQAVVLTMGAGDIYKIGHEYVRQVAQGPFEILAPYIPGLVKDEPLSRHATIRVGGPAAAFTMVRTTEDFIKVVTIAREKQVPFHIVGGGSNTLFSDKGYPGLIIKNVANQVVIAGEADQLAAEDWQQPSGEIRHEAADPTKYISFADLDYEEKPGDTVVVADAGVNLTAFIVKTLDAGLTGMQWFGGIPGVLGGAIFNNIHGGTHFIGERLLRVHALQEDGSIVIREKEELELGYDISRFHRTHEIILKAEFLLTKSAPLEVERADRAFREWTKRKSQMQPKLGSMGSTFQNISQSDRERIGAPTTAAGWLIDQCGLKGYQIGNAQIAPEHANFIINRGGATAADVKSLMDLAQKSVKQRFGVDITPEVFLIGEW